jgi:hypothetical protein
MKRNKQYVEFQACKTSIRNKLREFDAAETFSDVATLLDDLDDLVFNLREITGVENQMNLVLEELSKVGE